VQRRLSSGEDAVSPHRGILLGGQDHRAAVGIRQADLAMAKEHGRHQRVEGSLAETAIRIRARDAAVGRVFVIALRVQ